MIDHERFAAIVREAGAIAHSHWPGAGHDLESWEKKPGDPVCEADLAVDRFLRRELGALLPAAGWLSEETTDTPERQQQLWSAKDARFSACSAHRREGKNGSRWRDRARPATARR